MTHSIRIKVKEKIKNEPKTKIYNELKRKIYTVSIVSDLCWLWKLEYKYIEETGMLFWTYDTINITGDSDNIIRFLNSLKESVKVLIK